jgi:very-short-patch-repair endonuclease
MKIAIIAPASRAGSLTGAKEAKEKTCAMETAPHSYRRGIKKEAMAALSSVPESAMEVRVRSALDKLKVRYFSQVTICVESLIPDIYLPEQRLAIFLDGPVHLGKSDRDEELREKLARRRGIRVLSISYKENSKSEFKRIMEEIKQYL